MRRLLMAAAIATTLLFGAACSSERADVAGPGATTPTNGSSQGGTPGTEAAGASGAVTAPAGGNAKEVCAAARTASIESVTAYVGELAKLMEASGASDTPAAQAARKNAEAALDRWAAAMKEQAAKATDAQLKAALNDISAEVSRMDADIDSVDESKLDQLQQRLDALCAG